MIRRPASLHAVPRCDGVPALHGKAWPSLRYYQGAATSCRPSRRASSPSLSGAVDALAASLPPASRTPGRRARTVWVRPARAEISFDGDDRISQVPGEPRLHLRRALRPRQDHRRLTIATPWLGPCGGNVKGSCIAAFEAQSPGFSARCLRFAPAVARQGRKTRFRLLVRLCRAGSIRRVPTRGFRVFYISSSSPKLAWRNAASGRHGTEAI